MGYVAKQMADDEQIVFSTTLHPIIFLGPGLLALAALGLLAVDTLTALIALLLSAAWFAAVGVRYVSSEFAVTNHRVIIKVGFISRRTVEMLLTKVEGVQVDQGLWGRLFDYGIIRVTGTGGTNEPFNLIRAPLALRQHVQDGASRSHAAAAQEHLRALQGEPLAPTDTVAQLERLVALRNQGVLTAEEFEAQKRKILGS